MKKCKIGIDFHGVISSEPQKFAVFCREIRKRGVAVYIISGGPREDIIRFLDSYQIEYDKVWAIVDECELQGEVEFFEDGSFKVATEIWDKAKANYCAKEGILFHIDDSNIYGKYFVTPYCKYNIGSGCCVLDNQLKVDFNCPQDAADTIAAFLEKA